MALTKIKQKLFHWKAKWINPILLQTKYRDRDEYSIIFAGVKTTFLTKDYYSKSWFYPRYDNGRYHEPAVTQMLVKDFQQKKVFLDIGAHLGFYTCIAAKIMEDGEAIGFEMDERCADLAMNNVAINYLNNAIIHNTAVASQPSRVRYKKNTRPDAGLSIDPNIQDNFIEVYATSIDTYCEDYELTPDLIKIDVEGAEMEVLKGMENTFKHPLKIYIELHEKLLPKFNTSIKEVIAFLHAHNFKVYEILEHRKTSQAELRLITSDTPPTGNPMIVATN